MRKFPIWFKLLIFGIFMFIILLGPSKQTCISSCMDWGVRPPKLEVSDTKNSGEFRMSLWATETKKRFLNFHIFDEGAPFSFYIVGEPEVDGYLQSIEIKKMTMTSLSTGEEFDVNTKSNCKLTLNEGKFIVEQNELYFPVDDYHFLFEGTYCADGFCKPYQVEGTINTNERVLYGLWWWWIASGI